MKITLISLLVLLSTCLSGQKTKLIKDDLNHEEYYVLKSNTSVMHGEYKKFSQKRVLQIVGYYKNGVEDSIWSFYNSEGDLIQKYDVLKKDIVYYKSDENEKYKPYKLINGIDNPNVILDRPPLFVGGNDFLYYEIISRIRFPEEALGLTLTGKVYISFVIDKSGNMGSFKILKSLGFGIDEEVVRVFQSLPHNWVPGIYNGNPVDVEYIYPVAITMQTITPDNY